MAEGRQEHSRSSAETEGARGAGVVRRCVAVPVEGQKKTAVSQSQTARERRTKATNRQETPQWAANIMYSCRGTQQRSSGTERAERVEGLPGLIIAAMENEQSPVCKSVVVDCGQPTQRYAMLPYRAACKSLNLKIH